MKRSYQQELPSLADDIIHGRPLPSSLGLPVCLSGACAGADETFGECAMAQGHGLVHFLGPGDEEWAGETARDTQTHAYFNVSAELLNGEVVERAWQLAGSKRVKGGHRTDGWESFVESKCARRNFCQVRQADSLYVVAWRAKPGSHPLTGKDEIGEDEAIVLDIGGGTGWACQWYVDRFAEGGEDPSKCKLFLFNDPGPPWALKDEATMGKWSSWDAVGQKWSPFWSPFADTEAPPPPSGLYAGIGGTWLSPEATIAIHDLYKTPCEDKPTTSAEQPRVLL